MKNNQTDMELIRLWFNHSKVDGRSSGDDSCIAKGLMNLIYGHGPSNALWLSTSIFHTKYSINIY